MTRVAVVEPVSSPFDSAATNAKADGLTKMSSSLAACQAIRANAYRDWYQVEISEDPASYLMRGARAIIAPDTQSHVLGRFADLVLSRALRSR
jgi:hypothetical protein